MNGRMHWLRKKGNQGSHGDPVAGGGGLPLRDLLQCPPPHHWQGTTVPQFPYPGVGAESLGWLPRRVSPGSGWAPHDVASQSQPLHGGPLPEGDDHRAPVATMRPS